MLAKALRSAGRGAGARPVRLGGYILLQVARDGGIKKCIASHASHVGWISPCGCAADEAMAVASGKTSPEMPSLEEHNNTSNRLTSARDARG